MEEDWRFNDEWQVGVAATAATLFPNQGLHRSAVFLAKLHPLAIEYLEAAPVLACALAFKKSSRADKLYVASRVGGPISRGEPLKKVMKALGLAYPLRRLKAYALSPGKAELLRKMSACNPSSIANAMPEKPKAQRDWLKQLDAFRKRFVNYGGVNSDLPLEWAMKVMPGSCDNAREAADVADYLRQHIVPQLDQWSWPRAKMETELWHDQLRCDQSLPPGFKPDTVIDLSDWPDVWEGEEYEFFKLATPSMIWAEGRAMRHCVASYVPRVVNGNCSLYSIRKDMKRVATFELVDGKCVQLRGFANAKAPSIVAQAIGVFLGASR